ncbi:MAG TPA: LysM domain-containing protein [Bacilli bacterium]|nr:LysM domain-containing protein [Bacilli bacterium]HPT88983.1 LysM domain-containing protein [Bacilli bacterium]
MRFHIVRSNETVGHILELYNITKEELMKENKHITSWQNLIPGTKLRIPVITENVEQHVKEMEPFIEDYYPKLKPYTINKNNHNKDNDNHNNYNNHFNNNNNYNIKDIPELNKYEDDGDDDDYYQYPYSYPYYYGYYYPYYAQPMYYNWNNLNNNNDDDSDE